MNLVDATANQPSKFRTKIWVDVNDESWGKYDNSSTEFKTLMIKTNLCDYSDYSDACILLSETITIAVAGDWKKRRRRK